MVEKVGFNPTVYAQQAGLNNLTTANMYGLSFNALPQKDILSLSTNGEKVSFKEGSKLVARGFKDKAINMFKSIFKHPVKTLAMIGLTTVALAALPIIGISVATGAAALAIGFGAYALVNTVKDITKALNHNQKGEYNALREDLQTIGGDALDLALTAPFIPQSVKQLKNGLKYGTQLGINQELLANMKNAKGILPKFKELYKADLTLNYKQMLGEMKLASGPKLVFKELPPMMAGAYLPNTGEMILNSSYLNPLTSGMLRGFLKHELTHYNQYLIMARTEGVGIEAIKQISDSRLVTARSSHNIQKEILQDSLKEVDLQPVKGLFDKVSRQFQKANIKGSLSVLDDAVRPFDETLYQQMVKANGGIIKAGTVEAQQAQQYLQAFKDYPMEMMSFADIKTYKANLLEKEAFAAQKSYTRFAPGRGMIFNNELALTNKSEN